MPLHRDIFWVGRQWAVTGFGMQAVNQTRHGSFDIEASKIWDDDVRTNLCSQAWFNAEDFRKGLEAARTRYPEPPRHLAEKIEEAVPLPEQASVCAPSNLPVLPSVPANKPPSQPFVPLHMRIERWPARFIILWRLTYRPNGIRR